MRKPWALWRGVCATGLAWAVLAAALGAQDLPERPGVEVVRARCLGCHAADLIVSQRLSPTAWGREVAKMAGWGATMDAADRDRLQAYLAVHFGPRPAPSHAGAAAPAPGASIFDRACLSCHGADLVQQQRLSRAGWVREVDKMVRWGAIVSETDKDTLADYLAERFGLR